MAEEGLKNIFFLSARMQQRGISKYTINLARELVRRGYSLSVACGHGVLTEQLEDAKIDVTQYDRIERRLQSPMLVRRILNQIRESDAEVLHVQSTDVASVGLRLAAMSRLPMVVTVHRLMLRGWRIWRLGRRAARVIAVSEAVREDLVNIAHVAKEKIEVIPNGINLDDYVVSSPMRRGAPVVGVIGPLEKIKGQEYLIAAAKAVLNYNRDVQFLIAGDGSEEKTLRRMVRTLGIAKSVTFASDVHDYRPLFNAIDIFVLPSIQEGLGITVLEAMASARPVVASAVGGVYSLVRDGETGFLVDKGDSKAIAEKILQLLRDPPLAEEMGRRAREIVENEFDIWRVADQTIEQYKLARQPQTSG